MPVSKAFDGWAVEFYEDLPYPETGYIDAVFESEEAAKAWAKRHTGTYYLWCLHRIPVYTGGVADDE